MKKTVTALLLVAAFAVALIGCAAAPEAKTDTQEGIYLNQKLDSPSVSVLTETVEMLTREEAKAIAFAHAGVTDAFDVEIELDKDKGIVHYEVDFDTAEAEYDYEVEAYTGEILKSRKEERKTVVTPAPEAPATPAPEAPATGTKLTREQAKELALKHAGVTDVFDLEVELDKENGVLHYEVDFETTEAEYDYEVEAYTGEILKSRVKEKKVSVPEGERLTKEAAKEIALKHAGENPARVEVEFDKDDGVYKYEIEFRVGAYEYEYEVEAYTGEILKSQKEWDD